MNSTELTTQITQLATAAETLKSLLADPADPTQVTEICEQIATTATDLTAIGPIAPKPTGLYAAWLAVTLALGDAKTREVTASLEALDRAIAAVRLMRRTFGIAPGGA